MTFSDNLKDLGKTVAKYGAPLLGTVIGGPAGAAIGQIIASEFGGNVDDPNDLMQKIIADPNAAVKLAEIQSNCKIQLQQIAMQNAQNELAAQTAQIESDRLDRADARKSNVATQTIMPQAISITVIFGFFACFYIIAQFNQQATDHDILYLLIGAIVSAFTGVWNYWLGSSSGSRDKDQAIHAALATSMNTQNTSSGN